MYHHGMAAAPPPAQGQGRQVRQDRNWARTRQWAGWAFIALAGIPFHLGNFIYSFLSYNFNISLYIIPPSHSSPSQYTYTKNIWCVWWLVAVTVVCNGGVSISHPFRHYQFHDNIVGNKYIWKAGVGEELLHPREFAFIPNVVLYVCQISSNMWHLIMWLQSTLSATIITSLTITQP